MLSSGEDCAVSDGVDTTVFHNEDGPSDSTGREDIVTLILTPVDPSHKPSLTLQPPIKKRILQKSKGNYILSILLMIQKHLFISVLNFVTMRKHFFDVTALIHP